MVIHDVVMIEKLALTLTAGLNVFTGETGAGKSILLDAMGLALGQQSDAGIDPHGHRRRLPSSPEFSVAEMIMSFLRWHTSMG